MTPDQLFLGGRRACEAGAHDKAVTLIELAVSKGYTGAIARAYLAYLQYVGGTLTESKARKAITGVFDEIQSKHQQSEVELLLGHLARLDGNEKQAGKHYKRASKLDESNREASRWSRHYAKMSTDRQDSGGSFLNKLFQGRGKK